MAEFAWEEEGQSLEAAVEGGSLCLSIAESPFHRWAEIYLPPATARAFLVWLKEQFPEE